MFSSLAAYAAAIAVTVSQAYVYNKPPQEIPANEEVQQTQPQEFDYAAIKALMPYEPEKNNPSVGYNDKKSWWFVRNDTKTPPSAQKDINISQYGAYYLGDVSKKVIYLTFDEGYENGCTPKILDVLKENDVPAAFFCNKKLYKIRC